MSFHEVKIGDESFYFGNIISRPSWVNYWNKYCAKFEILLLYFEKCLFLVARLLELLRLTIKDPKPKRVPNSVWDICFVDTNIKAMYLIYCGIKTQEIHWKAFMEIVEVHIKTLKKIQTLFLDGCESITRCTSDAILICSSSILLCTSSSYSLEASSSCSFTLISFS